LMNSSVCRTVSVNGENLMTSMSVSVSGSDTVYPELRLR